MSERKESNVSAAQPAAAREVLLLDSQVDQPLGGGAAGGGGGVINIIRSHEMKSLWLELFIHGFLQERRGAGIGRRQPETLLTIKPETDSICHVTPWK